MIPANVRRRFCRTNECEGRLGLDLTGLEAGDLICIVQRAGASLVVREYSFKNDRDQERHTLIGACYMDGLMSIATLCTDVLEEKDIIFVQKNRDSTVELQELCSKILL